MKASDYRARVEKELSGQADRAKTLAPLRAAAFTGAPLALEERRDLVRDAVANRADLATAIPALIEVLADPAQPPELRGSALASLKAAAFNVTSFAPHRTAFLRTLRKLLTGADGELRERVLEVLATEKDARTQELLVDGLRNPAAALVPPGVALKYLSYDDHGSFAPLVRELVAKTDDDQVKEEGLRLLAGDARSKKLFSDLLNDKDAKSELRRLSAVVLQTLDPEAFEKAARRIVADGKDFDEIRATALGALTHVRDFARSRADPKFVAKVDALKSKAKGFLRDAAERFVKRSG